jgi:XTP/dITP diphosphohydrolase
VSAPREVVLASRNEGKLAEMQELLAPLGWKLRPITDFGADGADETGQSFVENALLKARFAAQISGLPAIADDSGIEVDALDGRPGVLSARFAGNDADDTQNNQKLLRELKGIPDDRRGARFYCVMVYLRSPDDATPVIAQGQWRGLIGHNPRGSNGFGYDPLFVVPDQKCTSAELAPALKNKLSHRAKAAKHLYSLLHDGHH